MDILDGDVAIIFDICVKFCVWRNILDKSSSFVGGNTACGQYDFMGKFEFSVLVVANPIFYSMGR